MQVLRLHWVFNPRKAGERVETGEEGDGGQEISRWGGKPMLLRNRQL